MKIGVIGSVINDYLIPYKGNHLKSLGGIYYTLVYLSALLPNTDTIIPMTYVGEDIQEKFLSFINSAENISSEGIIPLKRKNNKVILKYFSLEERTEISLYPMPSLEFYQLESFLSVDFLIINMISGWDIKIETLKEIRTQYSGKIYFDVHSYLLGRRKDGSRFYKKPKESFEIFSLIDYLQMNQKEFDVLNSEKLSIREFYHTYCISNDNLINLTIGENGSYTIFSRDGEMQQIYQPALTSKYQIDPTGCGDAFLAGFVFALLTGKNFVESARMANTVAGINVGLKGAPELPVLKMKLNKENII